MAHFIYKNLTIDITINSLKMRKTVWDLDTLTKLDKLLNSDLAPKPTSYLQIFDEIDSYFGLFTQ